MASLQRLVLPTTSRRAHPIPSHRLFYQRPIYGPIILRSRRSVHSQNANSNPDPIPTQKPKPQPQAPLRTSQAQTHRHEVQEHTESLNVPGFNPPGSGGGPGPGGGSVFQITRSPFVDAALTTFIGLGMVFIGGIAYVKWYKKNVLDKIEAAFSAGYDPALELAKQHTKRQFTNEFDDNSHDIYEEDQWTLNLRRKEQDFIDAIVHGKEPGHYYMLLGPKGSGKGSMIFKSMSACQAEGVSMCDAHPDLEVFRLRLGKALNYEFHEDSQTGLFQRRDPREGGPRLDIERALNKLEKVALRISQRTQRPLVLIINNVHHFKNDDDGRSMLLQLQQRAEAWAASGILTMIFSSDDFWPFHYMRRTGTRMHTVSIYDLDNTEAKHAITRLRRSVGERPINSSDLEETVGLVGGRLSYLNKVSRAHDAISTAKHMLDVEKEWLLSQIGLISDCDDDVMDEQKWSSCSWLLLREFVKIRKEQEKEREDAIQAGLLDSENLPDLPLPKIPYGKCRQIMTRADFIEELDHLNIIAVDIHHDVRPDSMLLLHAARAVCDEDGFDDVLDNVRDRIDEIESLHRTRELTFKDLDKGDLIKLTIDKGGNGVASRVSRFDDDDD